MTELNTLLGLKRILKKTFMILSIFMQKQLLILMCQLLVLEMIITHKESLNILGLWILMSKISIKMIRRHGGQFTRQLMNIILDRLNYFLKRLLVTVKGIRMSHRAFHIKSRRILKPNV